MSQHTMCFVWAQAGVRVRSLYPGKNPTLPSQKVSGTVNPFIPAALLADSPSSALFLNNDMENLIIQINFVVLWSF